MTKTTFYSARHLPEPVEEHWPEDVAELERLIVAGSDGPPRVIFGGGQHLRERAIGEHGYAAVRTDNCRHILKIDRQSNLVRVEAGIRWGDLREKLREEGYSLQAYRPYPDASSIGGLLARNHAGPAHRQSGDLREGCVALSAVSPTLGDYRYLEAPRKASGPDLRHLFIGGEGLLGAILDVTLSIQKPFPARLIEWSAPTATAAVEQMRTLAERGMHPTWCYWKRSQGRFQAVVHAPTRLLDAMVYRLQAQWGDELEVAGDEEARALRRALEEDMPGQRTRAGAERTVALTYSLAHLGEAIDALDAAREVEILDWSAHAATAFVELDEPLEDARAPKAWDNALAVRPIVGGPRLTWPEWTQVLKDRLDHDRQLAIGP